MSFKEKLLNKSNSYSYYKQNYETLKETEHDLKTENSKLNRDLKFNEMYIEFMNDDSRNKRKEIKNLQKDIEFNNDTIKNLQKDIEFKNESVKSLETTISDLEQKLQSYENLVNVIEEGFLDFNSDLSNKDIKDINIAYILRGFPIHSETFIVSEVKWLKENGYNVFVFTNIDSYKPVSLDFDVTIDRFNNEMDLETLLIKYDIDVMHTHFVYPVCTEFTFPVAEKLKIPFTVFAHAYDIFVDENARINKIDEISKSKYCKAIFTLSEFHKNYLIEHGADEEKIVITKQATSYELKPLVEKNNKIKNIVSISRFVEKKGLDVLIDAAKLLENEDYEFSIYGFGDLKNKLQNKINDLHCENIEIKGEIPANEVDSVLRNADLLIAPSKIAKNGDMDGFPTVIFEAMAAGTPYITTKVSAIPEIVEDGVNGFITEPNNPQLLAEKIKEVSDMSNEGLFEIRKKAQEDVKDISSVDKTMQKYIDILKE